jgi:hypothetical protein
VTDYTPSRGRGQTNAHDTRSKRTTHVSYTSLTHRNERPRIHPSHKQQANGTRHPHAQGSRRVATPSPLNAPPTTPSTHSAHSVRKCIVHADKRTPAQQPCGMLNRRLPSRAIEYAPDTSAPSASIMSVSRSLALSFQSAFQLSFTVLVCYRSRGRI